MLNCGSAIPSFEMSIVAGIGDAGGASSSRRRAAMSAFSRSVFAAFSLAASSAFRNEVVLPRASFWI